MPRNPFTARTPINHDDEFVGRQDELEKIVELVTGHQPQSLALYGERRIGKTSLLRALERRFRTLIGERAGDYHLVIGDVNAVAKPGELILQLIERVGAAVEAEPASTTSTDTLLQLVQRIASRGKRLAILVDDFDAIATNPEFDVGVFDFLRSVVSDCPVSMILTSRRRLLTMVRLELRRSPFFNVFHERRLEGLNPSDVTQFIARGRVEGVDLAPVRDWIVGVAGTFPLLLQIACGVAFDQLERRRVVESLDSLDDAFGEEAEPHFTRIWQDLDEDEHDILAQLEREPGGVRPGGAFRRLVDAGYIVRTNRGPSLFSTAFRQFVSTRLQQERSRLVTPVAPRHTAAQRDVHILVSYAHEDTEVFEDTNLLGYLGGLRRQGIVFWDDRLIPPGTDWKPTILAELQRADIVLLLVSQYWLNSEFVRDVEVVEAVRRRAEGLTVIPVVLAPCDWQAEAWLSSLQLLPQGGRPLTDYADDRGQREAAFLGVLRAIREQAEQIRSAPPEPAAVP